MVYHYVMKQDDKKLSLLPNAHRKESHSHILSSNCATAPEPGKLTLTLSTPSRLTSRGNRPLLPLYSGGDYMVLFFLKPPVPTTVTSNTTGLSSSMSRM